MILAANSEATPEVRAAALAGVREVQSAVKKNAARGPVLEQIDHEIILFLQNPRAEYAQAEIVGGAAGAAGLAGKCGGRGRPPYTTLTKETS